MKTFLKLSLIVSLSCLLAISCNKDEELKPDPNMEEGLKSKTGDGDIASESNAIPLESEVLYHKSYSKDLSLEEADALWNEEMINLQLPSLKMAKSTEWFHWVRTRTGTQSYNDTDGDVYVRIYYKTDIGYYVTGSFLDNFGDDREKGDWDYYLVRSSISGKAVSWVELNSSRLYLKGTDGWFVTHFYVGLYRSKQNIPSTGGSYIFSYPYVWLDNSSSSGWDSYYTGNIGYGRLNF
jgi:hypothetical protein